MLQYIKYPPRKDWASLSRRSELDSYELSEAVIKIMKNVKNHGDQALRDYSQKFDYVNLGEISVDLTAKKFTVEDGLAKAISLAKTNIETFHSAQKEHVQKIATSPGVTCWRKSVPIQNVGLYIPGGSAPLFSTLLMLAIPAQIASCSNIVVCTPPQENGKIHEVVGWTCQLLGIQQVYLVGGAQAIAAMTFGTETIPKVDKLFGPGNQYVTAAKQQAQHYGVAIDMPAGPSELLIIAGDSSNPVFIAADLLSQAEHGADSQVILVSDSEKLIQKVFNELRVQLAQLPRKDIAQKALENSKAILLENLDQAMVFSNEYAPEHLIIAAKNYDELSQQVVNAGSVFLGEWSCESAGDYASGTNHTLPTNGYARNYSGVSLDSFMKKITFQEITKSGMKNLGPAIEKMATAEQLQAHKNAVTLRLKSILDG